MSLTNTQRSGQTESRGWSDLPREMRDEIYYQYFSPRYTIPCYIGCQWGVDDPKEIVEVEILIAEPEGPSKSAEANILHFPKPIPEEAEILLFKHSIFSFDAPRYWNCPSAAISQDLADRMQHVEIYIDFYRSPYKNRFEEPDLVQYCEDVVDMFSGTQIPRESFWIICTPGDLEDLEDIPIPSVACLLLAGIRRLDGFGVVVVEFCRIRDLGRWEEMREEMEDRWVAGLGHGASFVNEYKYGEGSEEVEYNCRIEFYPREY